MTDDNNQEIDFDRVKIIQNSFEHSIKLLEKNIAESITNKNKLEIMNHELAEANKKFAEAEKCLDGLKIKLKNKTNFK